MNRSYNGINYSTICMDKTDFRKLKNTKVNNVSSTNGFTYEDIHTLVYGK